ncbi:MAG TPA: circularly permuted type 2 ATP-grasp protein [Jatrophihabitans sp.]|nr:circularly permuted type 2 ATP-grasp protein [Jatrophihabitans sp.]
MADLFDGYELGAAWDEMIARDGTARAPYRLLHESIQRSGAQELRAGVDALARAYLDQGVTFDVGGEERPFPLDIVPRVIDDESWQLIERGVRQRVATLEAFLADVYGNCRVVADGVVPRTVITTSKHFHRAAHGIEPPNGVRVHVSGIDLIRGEDGGFRVLEDNVRVPSGVSYVLANRAAMRQQWAEVLGRVRLRPVSHYPQRLLAALRAAAPAGVADPCVVVLTPGVYNSAYFEHAWLARAMGVELVEGRDLLCSGGVVRMRDTSGERRVDVIYRRVDDEYLDPVQFRADSTLGCPGLLIAARAGNVTVANAVGNGVADDKLIYTYLPDLVRYYLNEEPVLANVDTWRLEDPAALEEVLDRLPELVVKPVDGSGGQGLVMGPQADANELEALRNRLIADPRGWIAQPVVQLSTVPTLIGDTIAPRHVDLRPFAVNDGDDVWVLPGGLTRVALPQGSLVVNSSQGGGSKDTWVLAGERNPGSARAPERVTTVAHGPLPAIESAVDLEIRQQQQQQQQARSSLAGSVAPTASPRSSRDACLSLRLAPLGPRGGRRLFARALIALVVTPRRVITSAGRERSSRPWLRPVAWFQRTSSAASGRGADPRTAD